MPAKKLTRDDVRVQPADPTLLTREEIEPALARHHCALIDIMTCTHTRALATARAYHDLVARIEKEAERQQYSYDRWKADGTASEATMHAAWHTAMHLRALIPQKEPTK